MPWSYGAKVSEAGRHRRLHDTMTEPSPEAVTLAALRVQDAVEGRLEHGHTALHYATARQRRMFVMHSSSAFSWSVNLTNAAHLSFTWLEETATHPALLLVAEVGCICVYLVDVSLKAGYMGRDYLGKRWHSAYLLVVALFAADVCERAARLALDTASSGYLAVASRPLRPAVFLMRTRLARRLMLDVLACLPTIGDIAKLAGPLLLLFAALATRLFRDTVAHDSLGDLAPALHSLTVHARTVRVLCVCVCCACV